MVLQHQSIVSLGLLASAALIAGFFAYVYQLKRQTYLLLWMAGWVLYALHFLGPAISPWIPGGSLQNSLDQWLYSLSALFFWAHRSMRSANRGYCFPRLPRASWEYGQLPMGVGYLAGAPVAIPSALLLIPVAAIFWQESRRQETLVDRLLAVSFACWSVLRLAAFFADRYVPAEVVQGMAPIAPVPAIFVAMLMVMALYEEEKRRVERNMLALSNLNLANVEFCRWRIQRLLSQALDRVLGVVRLPVGALFLHHGDPQGPTSVVTVGLTEDFCRIAQEEGIDDYSGGLVARLGGLLGFRDLRDASLIALEKDPPIRRFRQLLLSQGLRSVMAISLQAKEQAFGVLLLGTPDNRRFSPAELRLLLALGHQIGMAVENSYLVQQTSRRSEELNVLNEIGRALSSTLHKRRCSCKRFGKNSTGYLMLKNFFIAETDPVSDKSSLCSGSH